MNKKLLVVALSSVLGATSAFASGDAILNVEGEIQINGQTVIDNNGNLVGLEYAQKNQIEISDYFSSQSGTYTFLNQANQKLVIEETEQVVTYRNYWKVDDGSWVESSVYQVVENGDGTYTSTLTYDFVQIDPDGNETSEEKVTVETFRETELTVPQTSYLLGSLMVRFFEEELLETTNEDREVGEKYSYTNEYQYGARLSTFNLDDGSSVTDCLVGTNGEIACKGLGLIAWGEYDYAMKLVKFEPSAASQMSKVSAASVKRDLNVKRIHQKLNQK
ncbi:hypothetical protein [Vibrio maritimus]|uniref:hypothetical protein n=1 Tax=Vibrio maritimus TaxID=990268 RepID=UPI001F2FE4CB|nr:hypothetical protein [Vibrio maritimus]